MTWIDQELSVESAAPIELHEFIYDTVIYRYTSSDTDYVDSDGATWTSAAIIRSGISEDQSEGQSDTSLECTLDLEVLGPFRTGVPLMRYNLYQVHADDPDGQVRQLYAGSVGDVVFKPNDWKAEITCRSVITALEESGLRRKCSVQCPHVLYGPGCRLSATDFEIPVTISSVSGRDAQLSGAGLTGKSDSYFPGGYLSWTNATLGVSQKMMVASYDSASKTATMVNVPSGLLAGASATIVPGCAHTLADCDTKFNNSLNYGGLPFIPDRSPFGGTTLY